MCQPGKLISPSGKCFFNFLSVYLFDNDAYKCCPGVLPVDSYTLKSITLETKLFW